MVRPRQLVFVSLAAVAGCSPTTTVEELDGMLAQAQLPRCAKGKGAVVDHWTTDAGVDSLQATYGVGRDCAQEWWTILEASNQYDCHYGVEYRACTIGEPELQQPGIMIMPKEEEVFVLVRGKRYLEGRG
jgi:hypothetical protein